MTKTSKNKRKGSNSEANVKSKVEFLVGLNTANLAQNIGTIGTDSASLLFQATQLASLSDIFRLYRINSVVFEFHPGTGVGTAAVEVPAGFLGHVPFGANVLPTSYGEFETPNVSNLTMPFGSSITTTAPLTRESAAILPLKNKDMPILQGAGDGWLATQADGTQTHYGWLFWAQAAVTAANTINYFLKAHYDVSFKDILDPLLISKLMQKHPYGLPLHITLTPGSMLHTINSKVAANASVPLMLTGTSGPCVHDFGPASAIPLIGRARCSICGKLSKPKPPKLFT